MLAPRPMIHRYTVKNTSKTGDVSLGQCMYRTLKLFLSIYTSSNKALKIY